MPKFSQKRQFGNLGEDIAEMFLVKQRHKIIERNYLKKWGELDIVSKNTKTGLLHFIEVKSKTTVTRENNQNNVSRDVSQISFTPKQFQIRVSPRTKETNILELNRDIQEKLNALHNDPIKRPWYGVSWETDTVSDNSSSEDYNPAENVHYWKQKRMLRAIQTYLIERNIDEDQEWQIDVITVAIDFLHNTATIKHIENVVFDV